jgi:hypothetical protein
VFSFSIPSYRIIRRRVIWLIGRWINVKLSPPYRPTLYEIIINLMNESEDLVVSIVTNTIARILKAHSHSMSGGSI